jgi:hypothetical protein
MVVTFDELGIDYVIVGGIAVCSWGNVRTTRDVDVIVDLNEKDIDKLIENVRKRSFSANKDDIIMALKEKSHFTIFDERSEYHIDTKGVYGEKERQSLLSKKAIQLGGVRVCVASPEDMIANKLSFGSEQDIKDAEGIYVRQKGKLDMKYLEERCENIGVYDEFVEMKERIEKYLKEMEK